MLGRYVYIGPKGSDLCLFRKNRGWLPAGIIVGEDIKAIEKEVLIDLFPNSQERLGKGVGEIKVGIKVGIKDSFLFLL